MKRKALTRSREFEEAVYAFAGSLNPTAEILFDHHVSDRDTGTLRQCDVWINARLGGHWPISILVSCKHHRRKLNISDIGTFCNEVRSTGASTGVIYSRSGFSNPALEKAKANGLACCRLYQNEPADIPPSIWLESFVCAPSIRLQWLTDASVSQLQTWNDVFDIRSGANQSTSLLDVISNLFATGQEQSRQGTNHDASFPPNWATELRFTINAVEHELRIRIVLRWRKYRGRMEANLLNGSYCFSNDSFSGQQISPTIDLQGPHPGEGWEEIADEDFMLPANRVLAILVKDDVRQTLRDALGAKPINKE